MNHNKLKIEEYNVDDGHKGTKHVVGLYTVLTLRLLISYIYGAPSKARNVNVVYMWTYIWQR